MSQPYSLPDPHSNSTNSRTVSIGMTNPGSQSTTAENNPSAERFGSGEEVQNMSATTVGVDYPVAFSVGENEAWQREAQGPTEWIPGFGKMDPLARREALNCYLKTPKVTYEGILMDANRQLLLQSQHEAQKKAAEAEALERAMRIRAEHQRRLARMDGQGNQPRRY